MTCAYCGFTGYYNPEIEPRPNNLCTCSYRHGRMGGYAVKVESTSRESTVALMREEFEAYIGVMKPETACAFSISLTKLDPLKIAKADAKREATDGLERVVTYRRVK